MYYISFLFFSSSLYNRKKYIFSFGGITQLVGGMPYETKGINLNLSSQLLQILKEKFPPHTSKSKFSFRFFFAMLEILPNFHCNLPRYIWMNQHDKTLQEENSKASQLLTSINVSLTLLSQTHTLKGLFFRLKTFLRMEIIEWSKSHVETGSNFCSLLGILLILIDRALRDYKHISLELFSYSYLFGKIFSYSFPDIKRSLHLILLLFQNLEIVFVHR